MNLYTLTSAQNLLITQLEASEFDSQTIADTLEGAGSTEALREKRLAYIAIIKEKEAMAAARYTAAKAIIAMADKDITLVTRLKEALFMSMQITNDKAIIDVEYEARIEGKPAAAVVSDPALIPAQYWRMTEPKPPERVLNKTLLGVDLKAGNVIEGASLGTNKKLVIL